MTKVAEDRPLTTSDLPPTEPPVNVEPGPGPAGQREAKREAIEHATTGREALEVRAPSELVATASGASVAADDEPSPLFSVEEAQRLRAEWDAIQLRFVDEPRQSVEKADGLVATVIERLAETFSHQRSELETKWARREGEPDLRTSSMRITECSGR